MMSYKFTSGVEFDQGYLSFLIFRICYRCLAFFIFASVIDAFFIFAYAIVAFSNICLCLRCLAGEIVGGWCVSRPIKKGGAALPSTQSAVIRKTNKQTKLEATWMGSLIRKKQISDSVYCGQYLYIISYIFIHISKRTKTWWQSEKLVIICKCLILNIVANICNSISITYFFVNFQESKDRVTNWQSGQYHRWSPGTALGLDFLTIGGQESWKWWCWASAGGNMKSSFSLKFEILKLFSAPKW